MFIPRKTIFQNFSHLPSWVTRGLAVQVLDRLQESYGDLLGDRGTRRRRNGGKAPHWQVLIVIVSYEASHADFVVLQVAAPTLAREVDSEVDSSKMLG